MTTLEVSRSSFLFFAVWSQDLLNLHHFVLLFNPISMCSRVSTHFFLFYVNASGGGSYFQSNEFAKGSVSLTRTRASTMLKPAALEKKMARMASRAALRPPVPGGGGGSDDSDSDSD